jgi:Prolyl oligopeptidase family
MPAAVLLLEHNRSSPSVTAQSRLLRLDMQDARTLLHEDVHTLIGATLTMQGTLAFLSRSEAEHISVLKVTGQPRDSAQLHEVLRCERLQRCTLLPQVSNTGELLLRGDPGGTLNRLLRVAANIHGGPWNHVRAGYNHLTQMLANRGYAVFEPNFCGSTGYGRDYLLAARGDFGNGRVQQDIAEGVEHLLARGIGDPQRVGIIGASFGGY